MYIPYIATLALAAPFSAAAALIPRTITADTIIQDVTNIDNGVAANKKATQAFEGGNLLTTLVEGTPVLATVAQIHVVNRKGYADAKLAPSDQCVDSRSSLRLENGYDWY